MLLGLLSRFPPAECGTAEYSYFLASALKKCSIDVVFNRFLRRDDLLKIPVLSDAVVLPYREERCLIGVSGALHLALGSFKPLICARVPRLIECREVVPELCVKPDNPVGIAYKLMRVLDHYNDVRELVKSLWMYAEKTNWLNMAGKHIELYKTLLG